MVSPYRNGKYIVQPSIQRLELHACFGVAQVRTRQPLRLSFQCMHGFFHQHARARPFWRCRSVCFEQHIASLDEIETRIQVRVPKRGLKKEFIQCHALRGRSLWVVRHHRNGFIDKFMTPFGFGLVEQRGRT